MFTCASYKWSNLFVNNFFSKSEERKVHAFFACQSNIILSRLSVFVIDKKRSSHFFAVHNKDVFMTFWNVSSHAIRVFLVETVICSATDSMTATREKKKCSLLRRLIYIIAFIFQWQSSCMLWLESSTLFVSKLQIFCAHLIAK